MKLVELEFDDSNGWQAESDVAILFATHDHEIIKTTANRIIDFKDDGKYVDKMTTYEEYLKLNRS